MPLQLIMLMGCRTNEVWPLKTDWTGRQKAENDGDASESALSPIVAASQGGEHELLGGMTKLPHQVPKYSGQ